MFKNPNEKDKPIPVRGFGYYWAKLSKSSNPEIIYWTGRVWQRIGTIYSFSDDDFHLIGEKLVFEQNENIHQQAKGNTSPVPVL